MNGSCFPASVCFVYSVIFTGERFEWLAQRFLSEYGNVEPQSQLYTSRYIHNFVCIYASNAMAWKGKTLISALDSLVLEPCWPKTVYIQWHGLRVCLHHTMMMTMWWKTLCGSEETRSWSILTVGPWRPLPVPLTRDAARRSDYLNVCVCVCVDVYVCLSAHILAYIWRYTRDMTSLAWASQNQEPDIARRKRNATRTFRGEQPRISFHVDDKCTDLEASRASVLAGLVSDSL